MNNQWTVIYKKFIFIVPIGNPIWPPLHDKYNVEQNISSYLKLI